MIFCWQFENFQYGVDIDDSEEILDMIDALWFCRKVSFLELQGDMFRGKI